MSYKYRSTAEKKKHKCPRISRAPPPQPQNKTRFALSLAPPKSRWGPALFFSINSMGGPRCECCFHLAVSLFFSFLAKSQVAKSTRGKRAAQHSEILDRIATKSRISHREEDENEEDVVHAKKANQNLFGGPFRRRAVPAVSSERVVSSSGTVEIDRSWGVARALAGEEEGSRRG